MRNSTRWGEPWIDFGEGARSDMRDLNPTWVGQVLSWDENRTGTSEIILGASEML
ncbi:MAG: hypothetical protein MUO23_02170 [Anaerolineales bacterium]|nr:hypothetical protein [Anaerolineales bacterium]